MRGIPAFIQTREDLNNLFSLARQGEVDKGALAEKINALLALQYHHIPILSINGNMVITRYCCEVTAGDVTDEGLSVTALRHFEPPEDGVAADPGSGAIDYTNTEITLSAAPASGRATLSIYKKVNYLTERGFDMEEINDILGGLAR